MLATTVQCSREPSSLTVHRSGSSTSKSPLACDCGLTDYREDIETCQTVYGKTITLSLGGATYSEGGFTSSSQAVTEANNVWAMFGPVQSGSSANRVFGNAVVDGFDFDFESTVTNMEPFASQLRSLMDAETAAGGKAYYLSAAPQCPYPDQADNQMLDGAVYFDFIMVQFYNNYCGVSSFTDGTSSQADFNIDTWDTWAHTVSLNPNVKVLVGIPGNTGAGGGYVSASSMGPIIEYCQAYSSFGGVMVWDMSQAYANPGFLSTVSSELGSGGSTPTTTTTSASFTTVTTTATITTTTGPASTSTAVGPYDQCGGNGYTGSTECESGYVCTEISQWWSQCDPA